MKQWTPAKFYFYLQSPATQSSLLLTDIKHTNHLYGFPYFFMNQSNQYFTSGSNGSGSAGRFLSIVKTDDDRSRFGRCRSQGLPTALKESIREMNWAREHKRDA